jgi:hypothetical protein
MPKRRRAAAQPPPEPATPEDADQVEDMVETLDRLTAGVRSPDDFRRVCTTLGGLTEGWPPGYIERTRASIGRQLAREFSNITVGRVLERTLALYDERFFRGLLTHLIELGMNIRLCFNNVWCYEVAGMMTPIREHTFKIEISLKVVREVERSGQGMCGQVPCSTGIGAMQLLFEHELVHGLIETCCPRLHESSDPPQLHQQPRQDEQPTPFSLATWSGDYHQQSGHSRWFMAMQFNLFGQSGYCHGCGHGPGR